MATELPKGHAVEAMNISHEENGFEMRSSTYLRGTDTDEYEMRVLGRIQQLNVQISQILSLDMSPLTFHHLAEFSFYLYSGICLHSDEYVGDCPDVMNALG
jgi:hypothetical protein